MRYVIFIIIFAFLGIQTQAQSYDLRFTLIQNDKFEGGIFAAKIQIKKTIGSSFKLGTSNIRFNYNPIGLALSSIPSQPMIEPMNFFEGNYNEMTSTGSANGFMSVNIDLQAPNSGFPVITESQWIDVAIIRFIIIDKYQSSQLVFRTSSPGNNIIFKDDQFTILEQSNFTGLDKPLSNKLKPVFIAKNDADINIYPNPASDHVAILISNIDPENITSLTISDMSGRALRQIQLYGPENQIDLPDFQNGLYVFQFQNENGMRMVKRVVVIR